jgi:hypothetical protein
MSAEAAPAAPAPPPAEEEDQDFDSDSDSEVEPEGDAEEFPEDRIIQLKPKDADKMYPVRQEAIKCSEYISSLLELGSQGMDTEGPSQC